MEPKWHGEIPIVVSDDFWDSLTVSDARHIQSEDEFIEAIENHIDIATNNGRIKPYITIFSKDNPPQIYNNQLIRYAGYETCGDPAEKKITKLAQHLDGKVSIHILIFCP